MSVHNVSWNVTSSGLGATDEIEAALNWLTGGFAEISREKVKSYHGSRMMLISAQINRKKDAKTSICQLGPGLLKELSLSKELHQKIDAKNVLHIRLRTSSLVSGSIELSNGSEEQIKGRIKLEVYPGQDPVENARNMLAESSIRAGEEGFPIPITDVND